MVTQPTYDVYEYNQFDAVLYRMRVPQGANIADSATEKQYSISLGTRGKHKFFSYGKASHIPQGTFIDLDNHAAHTITGHHLATPLALYTLTKRQLDDLPVGSWKDIKAEKPPAETILAYEPSPTSIFYYEKKDGRFFVGLFDTNWVKRPKTFGISLSCSRSDLPSKRYPLDMRAEIPKNSDSQACLHFFGENGQHISEFSKTLLGVPALLKLSDVFWTPLLVNLPVTNKLGASMTNPNTGTFIYRRGEFGRIYYVKVVTDTLTETLYYVPPQYLWDCGIRYTYGDNINFFVRKDAAPKEMVEMRDHPAGTPQHAETIPSPSCRYKTRKLLLTKAFIQKDAANSWKKISESFTLSNADIFSLISEIDAGEDSLEKFKLETNAN